MIRMAEGVVGGMTGCMSGVANQACASVLSLVANSTGSTPGRANAWKAATPASPRPLAGTTIAAGAQTKATQTDNVASTHRHKSEDRNAWGAATFAENRKASVIVGDNCCFGSSQD